MALKFMYSCTYFMLRQHGHLQVRVPCTLVGRAKLEGDDWRAAVSVVAEFEQALNDSWGRKQAPLNRTPNDQHPTYSPIDIHLPGNPAFTPLRARRRCPTLVCYMYPTHGLPHPRRFSHGQLKHIDASTFVSLSPPGPSLDHE